MRKYVFIFFISMYVLSGCTRTQEFAHTKATIAKQSMIAELEEEVEKLDDFYDTAMIETDDQVLIAYKIKHLKRFQMKKIEKDFNTRLEEVFPEKKIEISNDYKIFLETNRLIDEMKNDQLSNKEVEKKLKKIIQLKKEMT